MSNTYTEWGKFNYFLNAIPLKNNVIVRDDCLKFLDEEDEKYDIIVIDPPTISRSKKMEQMFDIQIDYVSLITKAQKLLNEGGVIFFSTNSRRFSFDASQFSECTIQDISKKTIPLDFHNQKIHRCWKIQPRLLKN
jgi:23S rRNA (cytosine1962-C5)-methyltransferase